MAGTYADVPGLRIPYHVDGSTVRFIATVSNSNKTLSGGWTAYSASDMDEMNDGDYVDVTVWGSTGSGSGRYIAWLFPQPITITGHNIIGWTNNTSSLTYGLLEYSSTTTDGADGTWTTANSDVTVMGGSNYRDVTAVNWAGVKAIRLHMAASGSSLSAYLRDAAFYGVWTPTTLAAWHPTLDQQMPGSHLDYGDIMPGTNATKQFRIKNGRGQQANNVLVSVVGGNAQSMAGLALSLDNTAFTATVTIPSIAAGAISPVVYVKRTLAVSEPYGNYGTACINFVAGSWT